MKDIILSVRKISFIVEVKIRTDLTNQCSIKDQSQYGITPFITFGYR